MQLANVLGICAYLLDVLHYTLDAITILKSLGHACIQKQVIKVGRKFVCGVKPGPNCHIPRLFTLNKHDNNCMMSLK